MRKKRLFTLLLSGILVAAAAVTSGALLTAGNTTHAGQWTPHGAAPASTGEATATSTVLSTSSASPLPQGAPLMITATVTPAAATGMVQFKDGSTNINGPVAVSNGTASTSTLAVGTHQLTAMFIPTNTVLYSGSTSSAVTFMISGATASSTMLATSPARRVVEGTPVTMTATVAPSAAAGTVQFRDGTTNVGTPVTVNNGTASRSATFGVGSHELRALFTPTNSALQRLNLVTDDLYGRTSPHCGSCSSGSSG